LLNPPLTLASNPSYSLTTTTPNLIQGQTSQTNIIIDTDGNNVAGAGIKIKFDPQYIEILSIDAGIIFDNFFKKSFDNNLGTIHISAFANSLESQFTGQGVLAILNFKTLQSGQTSFEIIFTPGETTDSNIAVTTGQGDILSEVHNLQLNIQTVSQPTPTTSNQFSPIVTADTPSPHISLTISPTETSTIYSANLTTPDNISITPTPPPNLTPMLSNSYSTQRHFFNVSIPPQNNPISFTLSLIISITSASLIVYLLYKITFNQFHPHINPKNTSNLNEISKPL